MLICSRSTLYPDHGIASLYTCSVHYARVRSMHGTECVHQTTTFGWYPRCRTAKGTPERTNTSGGTSTARTDSSLMRLVIYACSLSLATACHCCHTFQCTEYQTMNVVDCLKWTAWATFAVQSSRRSQMLVQGCSHLYRLVSC